MSTRLITAIPAVRQTPGLVVKRVLHEQERNKLGIRRFIGENIDVSETSIHNRLFDSAIQQRMYSHCSVSGRRAGLRHWAARSLVAMTTQMRHRPRMMQIRHCTPHGSLARIAECWTIS